MIGRVSSSGVPAPIAVLVPRLRVGGADAYIRDALSYVPSSGTGTVLLYVLHPDASVDHVYPGVARVPVKSSLSVTQRLLFIERDMVQRGVRIVVTQLVGLNVLRTLWTSDIKTVVIFQNDERTWSYNPELLSSAHVPFLITSCVWLADKLSALAPNISVRVIRPFCDAQTPGVTRSSLRRRWNIPDGAVIIGMIGTFKLHKRYTHAVRVLRTLRQRGTDAYLVILGGHSELYGGGDEAFRAVLSIADRYGLRDYIRLLGEIDRTGDCYQAFDVFLNTSLYEGLSRATVTAAAQNCPLVVTDVGGQGEVVPAAGHLVSSSASPSEIADAILSALHKGRQSGCDDMDALDITACKWRSVWYALQYLAMVDAPAQNSHPDKRKFVATDKNQACGSLRGVFAVPSQQQTSLLGEQVLSLLSNFAREWRQSTRPCEPSKELREVLLADFLQGVMPPGNEVVPLSEAEFIAAVPQQLSIALGFPYYRYLTALGVGHVKSSATSGVL